MSITALIQALRALRSKLRIEGQGPVESRFFSALWFYGAGILLVAGVLAGQPALSLLSTAVLAAAVVGWLWARSSLDQVELAISLSESRVFPDESVVLAVSLVNRSWRPVPWLDLTLQISDRLRVRDFEVVPSSWYGMNALHLTTALRWYERVRLTFTLDCPERGAFVVGPAELRAGDLFGFFARSERRAVSQPLLVYPRRVPLGELGLPARYPFGETRLQRYLLTDPTRPIGVRDYHPEDSFRTIHWKATARAQRIQVKVFEPTAAVQVGIFLNLDTFERYWEGMDYVRAESAIVAAASLATDGLARRWLVGIYANGVLSGSDQPLRIRPGRGPRQAEAVLEGLAKLTPLAASSFPRLLREEARQFPWGSTIVVISALMTDSLEAVLTRLLDEGRQVMLLQIGDYDTPALPGLYVHRLPENLLGPQWAGRHRYVFAVDGGRVLP
uniref:DUF58 domain-containing protein n=1 Tax=Thermorudis peleae TaxID=1382356 RepID=A0A831X773_9BACT